MSTKAEIRARIQSRLTGSAEDLTWARHEEILMTGDDNVLDSLYGFTATDTNATTNVVTETAANKTYSLLIMKQGGVVTITGTVRNGTGADTGSNEVFFNITNTEYQQLSGTPEYISCTSAATGETIQFVLTTNSFAALDTVGNNELVNIKFSYNTNA